MHLKAFEVIKHYRKELVFEHYSKIIKDAQDIVNDQTREANEILKQYCEMAKELKRNQKSSDVHK